jgi:hypothetical protein
MRLWSVQTGRCLFVSEFPTAVKRVTFSDDDEQIVCITEQRIGRHTDIQHPTRRQRHRVCVHTLLPLLSPRVDSGFVCGSESREPASMFHPIGSKVTVCAFPYMPNLIASSKRRGKGPLWPVEHVCVRSPRLIYENQDCSSLGRDGLRLWRSGRFVRVHHFDESDFKARPYGETLILNLSAVSLRV